MRIPLPRNTLVALTLLGIALTAVVSVALAVPPTQDVAGSPAPSTDAGTVTADAPTPNEGFTPAVQTATGPAGEHEDDGEYEEEDEEEWGED